MENTNGQLIETKISNSPEKFKLSLPEGTEELPFQIAGHRFGQSKHKFGILRHCKTGDILKPICDERSKREHLFYEKIFNKDNDHVPCFKIFRTLVPHYNGLFHDDQMNMDYIRLEDITAAHLSKNISLLDVKMGAKTYDPEATEEKRRSETNKYLYAKDLGFRILGMRFYDLSSRQYHYKNKEFGLQITPENVSDAFLMFVQNDSDLLQQFINHLNNIENWFENYNIDQWKFISSSLLFAYGIPKSSKNFNPKLDTCSTDNYDLKINNSKAAKTKALIKMIDFAHVFPNNGKDENYLFGLRKLKFHLQKAKDSCVHL